MRLFFVPMSDHVPDLVILATRFRSFSAAKHCNVENLLFFRPFRKWGEKMREIADYPYSADPHPTHSPGRPPTKGGGSEAPVRPSQGRLPPNRTQNRRRGAGGCRAERHGHSCAPAAEGDLPAAGATRANGRRHPPTCTGSRACGRSRSAGAARGYGGPRRRSPWPGTAPRWSRSRSSS